MIAYYKTGMLAPVITGRIKAGEHRWTIDVSVRANKASDKLTLSPREKLHMSDLIDYVTEMLAEFLTEHGQASVEWRAQIV